MEWIKTDNSVLIEEQLEMMEFQEKLYSALGIPEQFRGRRNTIPCECNTGVMELVMNTKDTEYKKYKCTSCGYVKEDL